MVYFATMVCLLIIASISKSEPKATAKSATEEMGYLTTASVEKIYNQAFFENDKTNEDPAYDKGLVRRHISRALGPDSLYHQEVNPILKVCFLYFIK